MDVFADDICLNDGSYKSSVQVSRTSKTRYTGYSQALKRKSPRRTGAEDPTKACFVSGRPDLAPIRVASKLDDGASTTLSAGHVFNRQPAIPIPGTQTACMPRMASF